MHKPNFMLVWKNVYNHAQLVKAQCSMVKDCDQNEDIQKLTKMYRKHNKPKKNDN